MKTNKKEDVIKCKITVTEGKIDISKLDNDPFFIKKWEDAVRAMEENPPPEWLLKRMRGED
jgi:hypothetical protein